MTTALTIVFYAVVYGTLSVLSWHELHAWVARRGQARREVQRCGQVRYRIDAPRFDRDPSPTPRRRAS